MKMNMLVESYLKFETALYQFYDGDATVSTIVDDLALSMSKSKHVTREGFKYFRIPKHVSTDGKEHRFYFKVGYCSVDREDVFEFVSWE